MPGPTEVPATPSAGTPPEDGGRASPARDLSGRTLGDYRVERLLGRGGMGEVYLARQLSLERPVALKVLKPELAADPTYMARFESEALAAARLNHPNIVHIYALGGDDGLKYLVMEYVPGLNLAEHLARDGVPRLSTALAIMEQAGRAIDAAGQAGLIHRDIKPENLLITPGGLVKVADFGLCQRPESEDLRLTAPGVTIGTPLYMSPEQVQGRTVEHRSDLYALGVTFYQLLAGVPPFRGRTTLEVALKHVGEAPESLAAHRPDLPPALIALVMRLLEKDPERRYPSAAAMLRDLAEIRGTVSTATGSLLALPAAPGTVVYPATPKPARDRPSLSLVRLAVVVLPLAALVGAAWGWVSRPEDLLAAETEVPTGPPGLWLEPWETEAPERPSPEAQYRWAQTRAPASRRPAAWLAVPGRFPQAHSVVTDAYVQLIRDWLRAGDIERLDALSGALAEAAARGDPPDWRALERLSRAAAAALRGDADAVLAQFRGWPNLELIDPAQAALGLEITQRVRRRPANAGPSAGPLDKLARDLVAAVLQVNVSPAALDRLGIRFSDPD
jgi:hypothetical protein